MLLSLPTDLLILILQQRILALHDLSSLSQTCKSLNSLVDQYAWQSYLAHSHNRPSHSLSRAREHSWNAKAQLRYDILADDAFTRTDFVARPLCDPWQGKLQPRLAIIESRLLAAAGSTIYSYSFGIPYEEEAPPVQLEGSFTFPQTSEIVNRDISALTFTDSAETMLVAFSDGSVECVTLQLHRGQIMVERTIPLALQAHQDDFIEDISYDPRTGRIFILSSTGFASITQVHDYSLSDPNSQTEPESYLDLSRRSWAAHFCLTASSPYIAFGTASATPLVVHNITSSGFSSDPQAILYAKESQLEGLGPSRSLASAVYGITSAPPCAPWGSSDQIIVSGWYDGAVRVHDLRSSSRGNLPKLSLPVLTFCDPWSPEPIYSVSCGGGSGAHVAAGTARHGVVAFWDVRYSSRGWSVHAPGNDPSPVYDLVMESSRVWGVTQSRAFVYDFGPGVGERTFPAVSSLVQRGGNTKAKGRGWRQWNRDDNGGGMRLDERGRGCYVTKYAHGKSPAVEM